VSRRPIEVGAIQGEDIVVLAGLAPGDRIVTAGVNHLRDGMLVHAL
jgi:multidrug efflux pump subunit AcrA (membrane-fusion protein)